MKKGDRVSYKGQVGTIVEARHVTPGMIDVRLDSESFVRRAARSELARANPGVRKQTKADLYKRAKELDIPGRSKMDAVELVAAIKAAEARSIGTAVPAYQVGQYTPTTEVQEPLFPFGIQPEGKPTRAGRFAGMGGRIEAFFGRGEEDKPKKAKKGGKEVDQLTQLVKDLSKVREELGRTPAAEVEEQRLLNFLASPSSERGMRAYLRRMVTVPAPSGRADKDNKALRAMEEQLQSIEKAPIEALKLRFLTLQLAVEQKLLQGQRSANAAAKIYSPSSDTSSIQTAIKRSGSGVFTRPDPPRMGPDGYTFCGNTIDGTAYYLAVSNVATSKNLFVTWEALYLSALADKVKLAPLTYILKPRELSHTTTRSALLDQFLSPQYSPLVHDMVQAGVTVTLPDGNVATLAGVEQDIGGAWKPITQPIAGKNVSIPAGRTLRIIAPSEKLLEQLDTYFAKIYKPLREAEGYRLAPVQMKARKVARVGGKLKREAGGKAVRGPAAEDLKGAGRAAVVTYEALPGISYAYFDDRGNLVYPKLVRSTASAAEKLKDFQPYGDGGKRGWHTWVNRGRKELTAKAALVNLSKKHSPRISAATADILFKSGMVYVGQGRGVQIASASTPVEPQEAIHVWAREKANSLYYSWVPALTTDKPKTGSPYQKCLTPAEDDAARDLAAFVRGLRGLKNALSAFQSLLGKYRMADATPVQLDTGKLLKRLGKSFAAVAQSKQKLFNAMSGGDAQAKAVARIVNQVLAASAFNLADEDAPLNVALGRAEELGLMDVAESDDGFRYVSGVSTDAGQQRFYRNLFSEMLESRKLGSAGLLFLSGEKKGKLHPLDDYFQWLGGARAEGGLLHKTRQEADVTALLIGRPPKTKEEHAAWALGELIRKWAIGGQKGARGDSGGPGLGSTPRAEKSSRLVPGRASNTWKKLVGGDQNKDDMEKRRVKTTLSPGTIDRNDTITLLLTEVLKRRQLRAVLTGVVDDELLHLLLLVMAYYELDGLLLTGPLSAAPNSAGFELTTGVRSLEGQISTLLGGKPLGSSAEESYTVYKTYNPVLFEMTRLFWPGTLSDPRWSGILTRPDVLSDVDAAGRYGCAAQLMQQAVLQTNDKVEVSALLQDAIVAPVQAYAKSGHDNWAAFTQALMLGRKGPTGAIHLFDLLWPLGADVQGAFQAAKAFAQAPFAELKTMKMRAGRAVPRLLAARETGLPPSLKKPLLAYPELQTIVRGEGHLDPADYFDEEPDELLMALRHVLSQATGVELYAGDTDERLDSAQGSLSAAERRAAEVKALKQFQKAPGQVLRRSSKSGKLEPENLGKLAVTGVYDGPTVLALAKHEASVKGPPGEREYAGQTETPWLMRERKPKRVSGAIQFTGQPDIYNESVLARVELRRKGLTNWLGRIDQLLTAVDQHLGA